MGKVWGAATVALLVLISVSASFAQVTSNGTIVGIVRDSSGGFVAGATVTVRNAGTDQTRSLTTNESGEFRAPALQVGQYSVKIEKEGFQTQTQQGLTLEVQQELVVNVVLQVGSAAQEVTVTAEAPLVNTTNGTLGGLVNEEKMADLPLNGRNYIDLTLMQAGVVNDEAQKADGGVAGTYYSSNGSGPWSNYYTIDGASAANGLGGSVGSAAGTSLGVDGIKEYKVITDSFSAEYGMSMGSQMVIVSKGGSNTFTGDVFEYVRNSIFDSRNFFDYTYLTPGEPRIPHLTRNNFGASFGGPIKKDKTFFYAVYEGLRQRQGITVVDTVPAAGCHPPGANAANGYGAGALIWNGVGTQPTGSVGNCPQIGGTTSSTVLLDPKTAPLLALFPTPLSFLPNNEWTFPTSDPLTVNFGQIRIDQTFSASDTGFIRYNFDTDILNNSVTNSGSANPAFPAFRLDNVGLDQFVTLGENHIFSPALLTTGRFSYSRLTQKSFNLFPLGTAGISGPGYSFAVGQPIGGVTVGGISAFGPLTSKPANNSTATFTIADDWFYTKGRHSFKFGTLLNRIYWAVLSDNRTGSLAFTNVSNFILGAPSSWSVLLPASNTSRYYAMNTMGLYLQDDFRMTPRLTFNMGLRYEPDFGLREIFNKAYAFRGVDPATPTQGPLTDNPSYKNLSPRVGFAYDLTGQGKTSIRGAFGLYYDIANFGSAVREADSGMPPLRETVTVNNAAPSAWSIPFNTTGLPIGTTGQGIEYDAQQPYNMQYNLTLEQQLPFAIGLSVSYVGTRGVHLWEKVETNPELPTSVVNGVPFWTPTAMHPANCGTAIVAPLTGYCRINPNLASYPQLMSRSSSFYNALQAVATKRVSRGLEFQVAFTYSQSLDYTENMSGDSSSFGGCGGPTAPLDQNVDKGPSCFNMPVNVRANVLYHFPTMSGGNAFVRKMANGWWITSIVSAQSGYPFTPLLTTNRSEDAVASTQADRVNINTTTVAPGQTGPDGTVNTTPYTFIPYNRKTVLTGNPQNDINSLMFSLAPVGTLGNAPRDFLRSPRFSDWDFSLDKDTAMPRLRENAVLQFRAEFFNLLNHANFGVPGSALYAGATKDIGGYSEGPVGASASNPLGTTGQITSTFNTSRQIQFALKLIF